MFTSLLPAQYGRRRQPVLPAPRRCAGEQPGDGASHADYPEPGQPPRLQKSLRRNRQSWIINWHMRTSCPCWLMISPSLPTWTRTEIENSLHARLYYATPRVIINAAEPNDATGTVLQTLDLRSTTRRDHCVSRAIDHQARTAQWVKGVLESYREGQALQDATGIVPITTAAHLRSHDRAGHPADAGDARNDGFTQPLRSRACRHRPRQ